jgi:hypothetical protein
MSKQFFKDAVGWGFNLWLVGYALGIIFFALVPPNTIGWIITPICTALTLWILFKKINGTFRYYFFVAIVWLLIAVVCDYFLLVKAFNPTDYYKFDVYLYSLLG